MTALELVREVRNAVKAELDGESLNDNFPEWIALLEDALAELERDQAFIEAAERIAEVIDKYDPWAHTEVALLAAIDEHASTCTEANPMRLLLNCYRARREERGKHGSK